MNSTAVNRAIEFLNSWLPYRFSQTSLPGLSVVVSHQGTVVFAQNQGMAALDPPEQLQNTHMFGVASQSKMFTAVAVMQLCEQGKVALDTPAYVYVPWLTKHPQACAKEITIRQLLSHSAGLARELPDADFWSLKMPFPKRASLQKALLKTPILVEPNTQLKYSNAGYALLGQAIEAASDQSYVDYVTQHIIGPLGLVHTFADYSEAIAGRTAAGYGVPYAGVRTLLAPRQQTNALASVVGVHTTGEDMCRFVAALCQNDERLLSDASKKELLRSQWVQADGYDAGLEFGMGFEVMTVGRQRIIGHSGHIAGHLTATFFDPASGLAVAVAGNSKDVPSPRIVSGIFEAFNFFGAYADRPASKELARFNARLFSPIATVEIIATPGKIVAIDPDDWQPFAFQEELEVADATSLRITTPGSVFNALEMVHYKFKNNKVISVAYAGGTLLPEHSYRATLPKQ